MRKFSILATVLLASMSISAVAEASFVIFNTGTNVSSGMDQSYTVSSAILPQQQAFVHDPPHPSFIDEYAAGASKWIGPTRFALSSAPGVLYTYTTTFDLTGYIPALTQLAGRWSTDNAGMAILLNGNDLGYTIPFGPGPGDYSFQKWTDFSVDDTNFFNSGINTLQFQVQNTLTSPTGLRVEFTNASAVPVPLPPALALIACGMPFVGLLRRRLSRRRTV